MMVLCFEQMEGLSILNIWVQWEQAGTTYFGLRVYCTGTDCAFISVIWVMWHASKQHILACISIARAIWVETSIRQWVSMSRHSSYVQYFWSSNGWETVCPVGAIGSDSGAISGRQALILTVMFYSATCVVLGFPIALRAWRQWRFHVALPPSSMAIKPKLKVAKNSHSLDRQCIILTLCTGLYWVLGTSRSRPHKVVASCVPTGFSYNKVL